MKTEIIAEIAQGYEGNPKLADLLVKGAIVANADSVKMQLVYADELCVPTYPYYDLFKSLEMNEEVWIDLVNKVHAAGKFIYFDVYGKISLGLAEKFGADGIKISTTDFYNTPLIDAAFEKFEKIFVSTGGVPVDDIEKLMSRKKLPKQLILMHGFQAEPTETKDNHLRRINTLKQKFTQAGIGFMDHSLGSGDEAFYLPMLAMAMDVTCIEKHITLDYSLEIEDFISALSVDRFSKFVDIIRMMEPALGIGDLILTAKEIEYKQRAGKLAVASEFLESGKIIDYNDIDMKRVSTTLSQNHFPRLEMIIGKKLVNAMEKNQPFEISNLQ
jgi:N,N'-diacetyllegionaminate synthase